MSIDAHRPIAQTPSGMPDGGKRDADNVDLQLRPLDIRSKSSAGETIDEHRLVVDLNDYAGLGLSLLLGLAVGAICLYFNADFFVTDDLQNEYLPKFYDIGHALRSGTFPVWTDGNWLGGNYIAEYQYGLFNPLCLLVSLLVSFCSTLHAAGAVVAFTYIGLAAAGCYALARQFGIAPAWAVLVSLFGASNPVLLYFYTGSWQPGMTGYAWVTVAAAALLALQKRPTPMRFLFAVAAAAMVVTAGWPQAVVAFAVFAALLLSSSLARGGVRQAWPIALAGVAALLIAAPAYLELAAVKEVTTRVNSIDNARGILTWTLRPALLFFFPGFYDFIPWLSGALRQPPVPLGYASVLALPLLCFVRVELRRLAEDHLWTLAALAALFYLVLTQGPSQLGPMRWPFRFIPYFHLFLLITLFLLPKLGGLVFTRARWRLFARILGLAVVLSLLVVERAADSWLLWQAASVATVVIAAAGLRLWTLPRRALAGFIVILASGLLAHTVIHARAPSLAPAFLPGRTVPDAWTELSVADELYRGRLMTLGGGLNDKKESIADLHSAHGLLFRLKTINGYSATGHRDFSEVFYSDSPHGLFDPLFTLKSVMEVDSGTGKTVATLAGIHHILIPTNALNGKGARAFATANFETENYGGKKLLLTNRAWRADVGTLTHVSDAAAQVQFLDSPSSSVERLRVESKANALELIFGRLYWPGYRASLDDEPLNVSAHRGIFVTVHVPPHRHGVLVVRYVPSSWPTAFAISGAGFLCVLLGLFMLRRRTANGQTVSA